MLEINQLCMRACVDRAWELQTLALPNPSVACMVLSGNDEVLALQAHQKANTPHAEVLALAQAFNALSPTPMPTSIDPLDCEATYHFFSPEPQRTFQRLHPFCYPRALRAFWQNPTLCGVARHNPA
ncbi:Diaminohydroxyphosphoribosylaminopyrimidine deaminase [Helicobacter bizzozeronii CCUG 35545]|nr:Diaminohydroxyphosphoribosylaminopyrimidine deaminase [Helicobacter bizzozeronii CCUG 35545]